MSEKKWSKKKMTTCSPILTERENEILNLAAQGLTNQEIGNKIGKTLPTIKWHLYEINSKLETKNRTSAIAKALKMGIVKIE